MIIRSGEVLKMLISIFSSRELDAGVRCQVLEGRENLE